MLALLSVWIGLASLLYALAIVIWRPLFSDVNISVTLYAAIFSLTLAGLTLWDLRKQPRDEPAVRARRLQAWVATVLSILSIACIYLLIMRCQVVPHADVVIATHPS